VTTMLEALANKYPTASLSNSELAEMQNNLTTATEKCPMGTEIPSRHANRQRSGRAARKAARSRQTLQAVGGVAGHWTKAANTTKYPIGYEMCKVR
jgi:hypothetical protein